MDISGIVIGIGQIVSSVVLGGMAVSYSHRVHKIEKNRDIQSERDKLIDTFLELSDESHRYFMSRNDFRQCVVNFLGRPISDNLIWESLKSDKIDIFSDDFPREIKEEFERLNTVKYDKISVRDYEQATEFLNLHIDYITKIHRICERLTIDHKIDKLSTSINELRDIVTHERNANIDRDSPDFIFYMYSLSGKINEKTIQLIIDIKHSLPQKI